MSRHIKRRVLGTGSIPKRGVFGTGMSRKMGVLGSSTTRKMGVLRTGLVKKRISITDVAQKGLIGSLFIKYLYFRLVNMINW